MSVSKGEVEKKEELGGMSRALSGKTTCSRGEERHFLQGRGQRKADYIGEVGGKR